MNLASSSQNECNLIWHVVLKHQHQGRIAINKACAEQIRAPKKLPISWLEFLKCFDYVTMSNSTWKCRWKKKGLLYWKTIYAMIIRFYPLHITRRTVAIVGGWLCWRRRRALSQSFQTQAHGTTWRAYAVTCCPSSTHKYFHTALWKSSHLSRL